jgi:subtilase family serine protease
MLSVMVLGCVAQGVTARAQVAQDRITQAIQGGKVSALAGTVHPLARAEYDQGLVDSTLALHGMTLDFNRSAAQQQALDALLKAQQDPSSPSYHRWLTSEEFGDRFGMSQADIAKATAWLQSQGFTVDHVADSRNAITFSGTAALAEAAFHTQIHKYSVNGELHFANATAVSLPSSLAATVTRIGGLNDFRLKPQFKRPSGDQASGGKPEFTSGLSGGHFIAPGDFAVIYDVNPLYTANYTGAGQTIGVIGQTDIVQADITAFRSASNLPAYGSTGGPTFTSYLIPGAIDPGVLASTGDVQEASLDLEWSGGVAKNANIVFVISGDVFTSLQYAIANKINGLQIPILTLSYAGCESQQGTATIASLEASLQQANAQGQTVFNSSGDSGAAACDVSSTTTITSATQGLAVNYPASSAYVTGVGGSEFMGDGTAANPSTGADQYWSANGSNDVLTSALSYIPEMVWNDTAFEIVNGGGLSAGGGGASLLFSKPSWQTGVPGIPSDGARDVPDVSLSASADHDPYLVCTQITLDSNPNTYVSSCANGFRISDPGFNDDQGLVAYGGTSVSTPSFAGLMAVIEQKLGTPQGLGNINPSLYTLASSSSTYASAFHDVTTGNNMVPCTTGTANCPSSGELGYSAGTGYDQASGLGSVDGSALATAFTTVAVKGGTTVSIAANPSNPLTGSAVTLTATVTPNSGTTSPTGSVSFTVDGVPFTTVSLTAGAAAATTSFSTGGPHIVVASYLGDNNFYVSSTTATIRATATGTAANTTMLVASPTSVVQNGSVTLTATVNSSTAGTIGGQVEFAVGKAQPVSVLITAGASGAGTAILTLSATAANGFVLGSNSVTATYDGDEKYAASPSTPQAVTVTSPGSITMTVTNMTISSSSPGNTGTSTITLTSTGGYAGTVNLTAAASTLNAEYAISPTSVVLSSGGLGTATISIQTVAASLVKGRSNNFQKAPTSNRIIAGAAVAFGCIFLLGLPGFRRKHRWPMLTALLLLGGLGVGIGCGGGGPSGGSPAGTYTVTVTATDSSNSAITTSANFTVTIQ